MDDAEWGVLCDRVEEVMGQAAAETVRRLKAHAGPMRLWLLRLRNPNDDVFRDDNWDRSHGHVVRAATEVEARRLAASTDVDDMGREQVWLDESLTTCKELLPEGKPGVIITDFIAG
jgi:hypothetical protein